MLGLVIIVLFEAYGGIRWWKRFVDVHKIIFAIARTGAGSILQATCDYIRRSSEVDNEIAPNGWDSDAQIRLLEG